MDYILYFVFGIIISFLQFTDYAMSLSKRKLVMHKKESTWNDAYEQCVSDGGQLMKFNSIEDDNAIAKLVGKDPENDYWIGLNSRQTSTSNQGDFVFADCQSITWTNWEGGSFSEEGEKGCVLAKKDERKWFREVCSIGKYFLCEIPEGACTFESVTANCPSSTAVKQTFTSINSDSECREKCQKKIDNSKHCFAYSLDSDCVLYFTRDPYFCEGSIGSGSGIPTYLRRCYSYAEGSDMSPSSSNNDDDPTARTCNSYVPPTTTTIALPTTTTEKTTTTTEKPTTTTEKPTTTTETTTTTTETTTTTTEKTTTTTETPTTTTDTPTTTTEAPTTPTEAPTTSTEMSTTETETPTTTTEIPTSTTETPTNTTQPPITLPTSTGSNTTNSLTTNTLATNTTALLSTTTSNTFSTTTSMSIPTTTISPPSTTTTNTPPTTNNSTTMVSTSSIFQSTTKKPATNGLQCICDICGTRNLTTINEEMKRVLDYLKVNNAKLSSTRRKKESATDERPSAQSMGYIGVIIIVGFFCVLCISDLQKIYNDIRWIFR